MSDREPFGRSGDGDLVTADARDVRAEDRERLADDRDALADERAELAGLRDSLGDQRELELLRCLGDQAGPAGGVAARSEMAQMAFALDRVRLAEAAIRRAELDRAAARRQRDQARVERDDAAMATVATGGLEERAWAEQRRDFVAFDRERIADARDHAADGRDTTADEREDVADARDRILRRWEEEVRRSERGDRRLQAAAPASGLDLGVVRRMAEQRRSPQLRVAGGGTRPAAPQPSGAGPVENGSLLTASFAALAQELITDSALAPALQRLLTLMVGVVAGCDCASIWFVASTEAGTETGPHVAT